MATGSTLTGRTTPTLAPRLIDYLSPGAPALMLTTGADGYAGSAYTWVVAMDDRRLRFGVDLGSSSLENLRRSSLVSIQIIGPGDVSFLVKGEARPVKERIDAAAPASVMLWEMDVVAAKDQSWPGVATTALAYEWPAAQREAMLKMEQAVYAEMRDFAPPPPIQTTRAAG
jgi:hypothetical protein